MPPCSGVTTWPSRSPLSRPATTRGSRWWTRTQPSTCARRSRPLPAAKHRTVHSASAVSSVASTRPGSAVSRALAFAQLPCEFVAAHLRPAGQIALLRDLVELRPRLGRGAAGALAPGHGRALLAERAPGLLGQMSDRLLARGGLLCLLHVAFGRLCLLARRHCSSSLHGPGRFPRRPGSTTARQACLRLA